MEIKTKSAASGSLKVSEEVIAKIARLAASETKGVALDEGKRGKKHLARERARVFHVAQNLSRPVHVRLAKETAEIDISVIIEETEGFKAASIGENIQRAVKTAVQAMAGITVSKVNVKITGIRLAKA